MEREGSVTAVLGLQRGDEGKGRFVDMLAEEHDIVARFNGGPNAGHTVVLPNDKELRLHLMPSGIAHKGMMNVIGNGCLVDPIKLVAEIDNLKENGIEVTPANLQISEGAHFILPHHILVDAGHEQGEKAQGTTKAGIWPAEAARYSRLGMPTESINAYKSELSHAVHTGIKEFYDQGDTNARGVSMDERKRSKEQFMHAASRLGAFLGDTSLYMNKRLQRGDRVLAEGAQAFLLDINHGMYPHVTSSNTTSGGISPGLGIDPRYLDRVIGVAKMVQSHVGGGHFVTEIDDPELLSRLHGDMSCVDAERGTTTERTRRLGYLDLAGINRAIMINGVDELFVTKADWVPRFGDDLKVCTAYFRKDNGEMTYVAPASEHKLLEMNTFYETMPNWSENICETRSFDGLPDEAQNFVEFIERQTKKPVTHVGVGPRRDQVIVR